MRRRIAAALVLAAVLAWALAAPSYAAPSAPAAVRVVEATDTSIRLEIIAPADNAFADEINSFIKLYAIRYRATGAGGGVKTVPFPDRAAYATLDGLKPGTTYYIEVFSVNGYDEASELFGWLYAATAPAPPPALDAPRVRAVVGDGFVTLTMEPGALGGGKLAGYEIAITGGGIRRTETAATGTHTVAGLVNGKPYSFSVRARNDAGRLSPAAVVTRIPSNTDAVPGYKVIAQPSSYMSGTAAFVIDANPGAFTGLIIDGRSVPVAEYTVGSDAADRARIEISAGALALGVGDHAVVFNFTGGRASAVLHIPGGGSG